MAFCWVALSQLERRLILLVLTREKNQSIIIYDETGLKIEVIVADIRGDRVRLGITAPRDITVDRKEIYEKKQGGL